jgi:hypothetical protein
MALTNANPAIGDDGARQAGICKDQSATNSQITHHKQPLRAEHLGASICTAGGIAGRGNTPVLALCRQLLAAGLNPAQAMEVYRGATLALRIRSIGEAAGLEINADGTGFRPARQPDAAPLAAALDLIAVAK